MWTAPSAVTQMIRQPVSAWRVITHCIAAQAEINVTLLWEKLGGTRYWNRNSLQSIRGQHLLLVNFYLQNYISHIWCITWPPDAQPSLVKKTVSPCIAGSLSQWSTKIKSNGLTSGHLWSRINRCVWPTHNNLLLVWLTDWSLPDFTVKTDNDLLLTNTGHMSFELHDSSWG